MCALVPLSKSASAARSRAGNRSRSLPYRSWRAAVEYVGSDRGHLGIEHETFYFALPPVTFPGSDHCLRLKCSLDQSVGDERERVLELNKVAILCLAGTMVPPRARSDIERRIYTRAWPGGSSSRVASILPSAIAFFAQAKRSRLMSAWNEVRSDQHTIGRVTWCGATLTFGASAWKRSETFQIASGGRRKGCAEAVSNERYVQPGSQNVARWWGSRQSSGVALRDDCASPSRILVLGP